MFMMALIVGFETLGWSMELACVVVRYWSPLFVFLSRELRLKSRDSQLTFIS